MKTVTTNINGYIEGYYGRLLNWSERNLLVKKLHECNFNTYFYCPKEDLKHRLNWRQDYSKKWLSVFSNFCKKANKLNINVLIGISPGIDFLFGDQVDMAVLCSKAKKLKEAGASNIVLMFDDIPINSSNILKNPKPEGILHAELANNLSKNLKDLIYLVPRVYSDELILKNCNYLDDLSIILNKKIPIFYCGKKIISNSNSQNELLLLNKKLTNKVIFWDNLYANDYCPQKIFLGPYYGRSHFNNTMINPTGLIQTDLFILDLIHLTIKNNNEIDGWESVLKKHKIPIEFSLVSKYFFPLNFEKKGTKYQFNYNKEIKALDFLLWKWKTALSREWYQYIFILKQHLQLLHCNLKLNRIKKIFPVPMKELLYKKMRRQK